MKPRKILFIALLFIAGPLTLVTFMRNKTPQTQPATTTATAPAEPATTTDVSATQPDRPKSPEIKATTEAPATTSKKIRWPVKKYPDQPPVVLGSTDKTLGFKFQVRLTSLGAAVETLKLTDYFATVADKRRYEQENDHQAYLKAVADDSELKGFYTLLQSVSVGDKTFYPLATRRITIIDNKEPVPLDLSGPRWLAGQKQTEKDSDGKITSESVTFQAKIWRNKEPFLLLKKTYTLRVGSYSIDVHTEAENLRKDSRVEFSLMQYSVTGLSKEDLRGDNRALAYGQYEDGKAEVETLAAAKELDDMSLGLKNAEKYGRSDSSDPVMWIGQTNKFFAALTYVVPKETGKLVAPEAKASFFGVALEQAGESRTFLSGMNLGRYELEPGGRMDVRLDVFAGPKKRNLFDDTTLYRDLGYKQTLHFGACFCAFQPLTLSMMWLLDFFYDNVAFYNYGVAIILLVILVRICLHPLMKKQQVSMMRMQKLAPEMEKVKKKYANDATKRNAEMMKLYKEQGATPILGCLPMFLQMPILIALWTSINASVELRHAAFLPVWIIDLAAPDGLIPLASKINIPLLGAMIGPVTGFNLLPLLLCVVMFLQMKMNPQMSGASASPQQQSSQTMMKYMMPGMMLVFFYNAPSGLNLYFLTSTFAGLLEQQIIRKHIREKEAAEAAVETTIEMPGKRFRGQKPKKPQGPFQVKR